MGLKIVHSIPSATKRTVTVTEPPTQYVPIRVYGNCFFRTLSHILIGVHSEHRTLRKMISDYIAKHNDSFTAISQSTDYTAMSGMSNLGVWATELEVFAAATMLATDICVYTPCGCDKVRSNLYKWLRYSVIQGLPSISGILPSKDTIYITNKSEHYYPVYKL